MELSNWLTNKKYIALIYPNAFLQFLSISTCIANDSHVNWHTAASTVQKVGDSPYVLSPHHKTCTSTSLLQLLNENLPNLLSPSQSTKLSSCFTLLALKKKIWFTVYTHSYVHTLTWKESMNLSTICTFSCSKCTHYTLKMLSTVNTRADAVCHSN